MNLKQFFRPSPLLIIATITLLLLLSELFFKTNIDNDFRYPLMQRQLIFFVEIIAVDILLKFFFLKRKILFWSLQILVCLLLFYYWIVSQFCAKGHSLFILALMKYTIVPVEITINPQLTICQPVDHNMNNHIPMPSITGNGNNGIL